MRTLEMSGGFEPFVFTAEESRSILMDQRVPILPPPEYTLVDNAARANRYTQRPRPSRGSSQSCNCNICSAQVPQLQSFSVTESLRGAGHAGAIAVFYFSDTLERYVRFVTPGISSFLLELAHNTVSYGIGFALAMILLLCWFLVRTLLCFISRLSNAIDEFDEELMPNMTTPSSPPRKGCELTRCQIQQDKMTEKAKSVSHLLWFEVGTTMA